MFFLNKPVFIIPMEHIKGLAYLPSLYVSKQSYFRIPNYLVGFELHVQMLRKYLGRIQLIQTHG